MGWATATLGGACAVLPTMPFCGSGQRSRVRGCCARFEGKAGYGEFFIPPPPVSCVSALFSSCLVLVILSSTNESVLMDALFAVIGLGCTRHGLLGI